jgi:pimeloyl-ACP methyl ester carboxylesterase
MRIRRSPAVVLLMATLIVVPGWLAWTPDRPLPELKDRWAPPPSAFIDVHGLPVHVRDQGPRDDPTPIVLIHGTSASLHTWEGWADVLTPERRVITMDLPGFGLTGPNARDDYRTETYTQFIIDLLDTLQIRRCVVGGNSLGGDIAWQVALKAPQRVERLILVDAAGYPMQAQSMPIGFRIANLPLINRLMTVTLPRFLVEASVRDVYGDPARVTPALVDRYQDMALRAGNRRALIRRFQQADFGEHADNIRRLQLPTLILWGARDRLLPVANAYAFQHDIAGSELVVFDDLGHVPHEEAPLRTARAVREFLSR